MLFNTGIRVCLGALWIGLGGCGSTDGNNENNKEQTAELSGSVIGPTGSKLPNVIVTACVLTADQKDCDAGQSRSETIPGGGSTVQFTMRNLPIRPYLVLALADQNNNRSIDELELFGVQTGSNGVAEQITPPRSELKLSLFPVPPQAPAPPALVGTWSAVGSYTAITKTIYADGTFVSQTLEQPERTDSCVAFARRTSVTSGRIGVEQGVLYFFQLSGKVTQLLCNAKTDEYGLGFGASAERYEVGVDGKTLTLFSANGNPVIYSRQ